MTIARCVFPDCIWTIRHPVELTALDTLHAHIDQRHPSAARVADLRAAVTS